MPTANTFVGSTEVGAMSSVAIAEYRYRMENLRDLTTLLRRRNLKAGEKSVDFPFITTGGEAVALTEGNEVTPVQSDANAVQLTPTVGASFAEKITDLAQLNSPEFMADFGRRAADKVMKKKNKDVFALFDGFSNSLGSSGQDITVNLLKQAAKTLVKNGAYEPPFFVFTSEVWEDLVTDLQNTSGANTVVSDNMKDRILSNGPIAMDIVIFGCIPVLATSGIDESGDVKCGVFARDALGYAVGWDLKIEMQRNALAVATHLVASAAYSVGEIDDALGVELLVDGADSGS